MKAGIALDRWKFSIFLRRLDEAGYNWSKLSEDCTKDTIFLTVEIGPTELHDLAEVVRAANAEAAAWSNKRKDDENG